MNMIKHCSVWILAMVLAMSLCRVAAAADVLNLVPAPLSIKQNEGPAVKITADSRVIAQIPSLQPLVAVVQNEIRLTTGLTLKTGEKGTEKAGDIVLATGLKFDSLINVDEGYNLDVTDRVTVLGMNYQTVAEGTATLLQMLGNASKTAGQPVDLPQVQIRDMPAYGYRAVMVDPARERHTVDDIKNIIILARFYKVRYVHLHLTDDTGFTFPSTKYPQLVTREKSYTMDEVKELESFSQQRGVTIIPEVDMPGKSLSRNKAAPEIFGGKAATSNYADDKVVDAYGTIVGEILDVFKSTPYFHIGADEVSLTPVVSLPSFQARMKELGTKDPSDVFRWFIGQMDEQVKSRGREMICWEGFARGGKIKVPTDVIVMPFDCYYYGGSPANLLKDGYRVINSCWTPLYLVTDHRWQPERIYAWNIDTFGWHSRNFPETKFVKVEPTSQIIGGEMSTWLQTGAMELPSLRTRLPALAERLWNPTAGPFASYEKRAAVTDKLLTSALSGLTFKIDGMSQPNWSGPGASIQSWFAEKAVLTIAPNVPGTIIRYTTELPLTDKSPVLSGPLTITSSQTVWAQAFDKDGKALGLAWTRPFILQPLKVQIKGVVKGSPASELPSLDDIDSISQFADKAVVTITSALPDAVVRYTLDATAPDSKSPQVTGPIDIDDSCTLSLQSFDKDNHPIGQKWTRRFHRTTPVPNLTLNKPVTVSSQSSKFDPSCAVDGQVNQKEYWGALNPPQWLQVDLQAPHTLDRIVVYTFWDVNPRFHRYYQYKVDVSIDGKKWTTVIDRSKNTVIANPRGYEDKFAPTQARYIRVNMLKNSANPAVHIVELRAFEAGGGE